MTLVGRRAHYVAFLDGSGHVTAEVGGKGAGLDWLVAQGYPVPEAVVVTTDAYRAVVADDGLRRIVADLRTAALPEPDRIAATAAALEQSFLDAPIPDPVGAAIDEIAGRLLSGGPVAVRSSATAEDLSEASFAGQYLTITNVTNGEELHQAIRRCWASLWMPAALAYRSYKGVADDTIAMAVVVQQMVVPSWSGVSFTRDPQGRRHLLRIEAVSGLGEDLVSGRVTPQDYLVRRDTLEIVSELGNRTLPFLEDLARLSLRIEQAAQTPQDIEWAFVDSELTVLQARPITEMAASILNDGFDTEDPAQVTYTPHGVVEMLPGIIPPLLWTINAPMLENAFRATFTDMGGAQPAADRRIINRFRGHAALDLSSICDIARSMPGGTPHEVERQYLGQTIGDEPQPPVKRGPHLLAAMRIRQVHNRIADEVDLLANAAPALARMQLDLTELPVRRLVSYRQCIRDLAWRGHAAEVGASSAAGATYRALELLLERWLSQNEAASWAQRLTRGALENSPVGAARSKALENVLESHAASAIVEVVRSSAPDARGRMSALGRPGLIFLADLDGAIAEMGSQSVYGGPTWAEDDSWIWRQLRMMSLGEVSRMPPGSAWSDEFTRLEQQLSSSRRWRRTRLLTGQIVDMRLRWLHRQVEETVRFLALRERAKNALLVLGGEERRILLESERRLVASRQLPPASIDYLTDSELEGMLFGSYGVDEATLERRKAVALESMTAGPLPDWFTEHPDTIPMPDIAHADRLEGWAASPGRITGPVRIVKSLADGTRLKPGEIMVAHATDPSWTPLFLVASGIVLEMGGPLSHAAIIAREFGLPAVLNVRQATRALSEGEAVLVDGTLGVIHRLEPRGAS